MIRTTTGLALLIASICVLAAPPTFADDTKSVILCSRWRASFDDADFGEDYMDSKDPTYYPASYTYVEVGTLGGSPSWVGMLDSGGCTPTLTMPSGTTAFMKQSTIFLHPDAVPDSGGTYSSGIIKIADSSDEKGSFSWYYNFVAISEGPGFQIKVFYPGADNAQTRVAATVSQILRKADRQHYPYNVNTYIQTGNDNGLCDYSCYNNQHDVVCIDAREAAYDDSKLKYVIAHEIGHKVAYSHGSMTGEGSLGYGAYPPNNLCDCTHVSTDGPGGSASQAHCLQSREVIGTAQTEGWAQFFATSIFNNRDQSDCRFVYYKEMMYSSPLFGYLIMLPPMSFNCTTDHKWMENNCDPGDQSYGVELDWLDFFWRVYSANGDTGAVRLSLNELHDIWSATSGTWSYGKRWDDLLASAISEVGFTKAARFYNVGDQTGVNHCD